MSVQVILKQDIQSKFLIVLNQISLYVFFLKEVYPTIRQVGIVVFLILKSQYG